MSLLVLPVAIAARYWKHLTGAWRQKTPALIAVAPTQKAPAFVVTQLLVLALFVALERAAMKGFRTERRVVGS